MAIVFTMFWCCVGTLGEELIKTRWCKLTMMKVKKQFCYLTVSKEGI